MYNGRKVFYTERDLKYVTFSENTRQLNMWNPRPKYIGTNFNADIFIVVV